MLAIALHRWRTRHPGRRATLLVVAGALSALGCIAGGLLLLL